MSDPNTAARFAERWLDRETNEAERLAISGQLARAKAMVADHPLGANGGLFTVEPAQFDALMAVGERS